MEVLKEPVCDIYCSLWYWNNVLILFMDIINVKLVFLDAYF